MAASVISNVSAQSLSNPNMKLLCFYLQISEQSRRVNSKKVWKFEFNSKKKEYASVWLQGIVLEVDIDGANVLISDETGTARITGIKLDDTLPLEDLYLIEKGDYVMAVGELQAAGKLPVVKAQKLRKLRENVISLKAFWPLEVKHQLRFAPMNDL